MHRKRRKNDVCPNCGFRFDLQYEHSNFCLECGQENHDLNVPFLQIAAEFIESIFHFDTKSIRTLRALVLSPGFLTVEFKRGRRARYVMPARLYVFISFLFFLILSLSSVKHKEDIGEGETKMKSSDGLSISYKGLHSAELNGLSNIQLDSVMLAHSIEATALNQFIIRQIARIGSGGQKEFNHMIVKGISYMMFLLMPFFAVLILVFHRKTAWNYIVMLVYSLHFHSFVFLLVGVLLLLSRLPFLSFVPFLIPVVLAVYLYVSLRVVFAQSRGIAFFKTMIIGFLHLASVAFLFLATVFTSILLF